MLLLLAALLFIIGLIAGITQIIPWLIVGVISIFIAIAVVGYLLYNFGIEGFYLLFVGMVLFWIVVVVTAKLTEQKGMYYAKNDFSVSGVTIQKDSVLVVAEEQKGGVIAHNFEEAIYKIEYSERRFFYYDAYGRREILLSPKNKNIEWCGIVNGFGFPIEKSTEINNGNYTIKNHRIVFE